MKASVLFSVLFHALFFSALLVFPSRSRSIDTSQLVYEVELVSMPRIIEEVPQEASEEVRSPPEVPAAEPEPAIPKKETPKKIVEQPVEVATKEETESVSDDSAASRGPVGTSEVKVETEDFPYSYYLNLIHFRIRENWRPPYQTLKEDEKMTAVVGFRVLRDGNVTGITLEAPSNRFLFDQAAQRAIYAMGKLPPLPQEFSGDFLTVHIEFESVW